MRITWTECALGRISDVIGIRRRRQDAWEAILLHDMHNEGIYELRWESC
jgi:hypothetical protein